MKRSNAGNTDIKNEYIGTFGNGMSVPCIRDTSCSSAKVCSEIVGIPIPQLAVSVNPLHDCRPTSCNFRIVIADGLPISFIYG
jgi:hypothetical protein